MICEQGKIVSIEPDWVWVETIQTSSCTACSAKAGCGQSLLNSIFAGKRHYVKVSTSGFEQPLAVHDQVELAIPEDVMLTSSFWVYLLPLVLLIGGALMAQQLYGSASDIPSVAGAFGGFVLSLSILRGHAMINRRNPKFHPVLHKKLSSAAVEVQSITIDG